MEYKIKAIEDILFQPTDLSINVVDVYSELVETQEGSEEVKFINVRVSMKQRKTSTTIIEEGILKLPFAVWQSVVSGYDAEKREPILDETKFRAILKTYKIDLDI